MLLGFLELRWETAQQEEEKEGVTHVQSAINFICTLGLSPAF